jgi:parallel beta-helix repeat protein
MRSGVSEAALCDSLDENVFGSHDLRIVRNSFRRNAQLGKHIEDSRRNLVKGNAVVGNGDFGILIQADAS